MGAEGASEPILFKDVGANIRTFPPIIHFQKEHTSVLWRGSYYPTFYGPNVTKNCSMGP